MSDTALTVHLMAPGVGNQRKWGTFVKERSGGYGTVAGLPEQVAAAFAAGQGL